MGFWLFLLGVLVLVWWSSSRNKQAETPPYVINQQWMDYLAETYRQAKKPAEKALLQKLLQDLLAQGMPTPTQPLDGSFTHAKNVTMATEATAKAGVQTDGLSEQPGNVVNEPAQRTQITREPIDNATLLLYFGAFLFLAAAGLFVALAGENGSLRVGIIAATSMALYGGGLWLFGTKSKLTESASLYVCRDGHDARPACRSGRICVCFQRQRVMGLAGYVDGLCGFVLARATDTKAPTA